MLGSYYCIILTVYLPPLPILHSLSTNACMLDSLLDVLCFWFQSDGSIFVIVNCYANGSYGE